MNACYQLNSYSDTLSGWMFLVYKGIHP